METCLESIAPLFGRNLKIITWGDLREWGNSIYNQGSSLKELKKRYESLSVDLSLMKENWSWSRTKTGRSAQTLSWMLSINSKNVIYMVDDGWKISIWSSNSTQATPPTLFMFWWFHIATFSQLSSARLVSISS